MTDESDFDRCLDADPGNYAMRLAFSDWLEDRGDPRAAGYRWLGTRRKRPAKWADGVWVWHVIQSGMSGDCPSFIPNSILPVVERPGRSSGMSLSESFPSRKDAEEALIAAMLPTV